MSKNVLGKCKNSVDPNEMPCSVASHLGLHCLLRAVCPYTYCKYINIQISPWNHLLLVFIRITEAILVSTHKYVCELRKISYFFDCFNQTPSPIELRYAWTENSADPDQLLKKPADTDLHCLPLSM